MNSKNIFLINESDNFQIKIFKKKIINKIRLKDNFEIIKFDLNESNFNVIFNDFWTDSLFFDKKLFIIDSFDELLINKNNEKCYEYLMKLFKNPNYFIFIYRKENLIKNKKFNLFLEKINYVSGLDLTFDNLKKFIVNYLKSKKASINSDAIEYIINLCPKSYEIIKNELDKIVNIKKNISIELVKNNLTNYLLGDIFSLVNSIFYKNIKEFQKNYFYIKNTYDVNNGIISLLFENIRIIKNIKELSLKSDKEIIAKLKLHPYRFKSLKTVSNFYSKEDLNKMIDIIYDYEINKNKITWNKDLFHLILLKIYKVGGNFASKQFI